MAPRTFGLAPEIPTPARSTAMWRARAIAKVTPHGEVSLYDAVEAAILAITDIPTKAAAQEAWERGTIFNMDGQLVPLLMDAVGGITEAAVLGLIAQAEQLPA